MTSIPIFEIGPFEYDEFGNVKLPTATNGQGKNLKINGSVQSPELAVLNELTGEAIIQMGPGTKDDATVADLPLPGGPFVYQSPWTTTPVFKNRITNYMGDVGSNIGSGTLIVSFTDGTRNGTTGVVVIKWFRRGNTLEVETDGADRVSSTSVIVNTTGTDIIVETSDKTYVSWTSIGMSIAVNI